MRGWLERLLRPVRGTPPPAPPEMPPEVLPCDWVTVGNALRRTLGLCLYEGPPRYPTIEELEAWEHAFPDQDMVGWLRRLARQEAAHREWMAQYPLPVPRQGRW